MIANAQMWGSLFWLAIGAYVTWAGRDLGLGHLHEPGSGFALFWIGLIMCALALVELARAFAHGGESVAALWAGTRWPKVLLVTVMLLVFGFAFERIGFVVCSIAMLLVLMLWVDPVRPRTAFLVSILSTLVVWAVLTEALKIQMPAGLLAGAPEEFMRHTFRSLVGAVSAIFR